MAAPMGVTMLGVVGPPLVIILETEEPLPQNVDLAEELLDFIVPFSSALHHQVDSKTICWTGVYVSIS